jgi:putative hemolysin
VLAFVLIGGVFAASEIALVSLRESQVQTMAEKGRRGRSVARLVADSNRFLAAVQIGVTLAGFLSAAFGGAALSGPLAERLEVWGVAPTVAAPMALVGITLVISYFSLVLGELVPKRLALQRSEGIALAVAPSLERVAMLARPVIWLLSRSTNVVMRLFGGDPQAQREGITEEELRGLVAAHESLSADERQLIDDVFSAGERQVREVLVPRTEVGFLSSALAVPEALELTREAPHSRYPVIGDSSDDIVGFVHVRDLLAVAERHAARVGDLARPVKMLPGTKRVLPALSELRREGHHIAVVVDEYGGTAGIVTLEDLIEELIGDIRDEYDATGSDSRRLVSGELVLDGFTNLEDFAQETRVVLPDGPYETVAGYLMAELGHVPEVGESVEVEGHRLSVREVEGRRVSRVQLTVRDEPAPPAEPGSEPGTEPETGSDRSAD